MNRARVIWAILGTAVMATCAVLEYRDLRPESATLPPWIRGEFGASAERYAGRTVSVDSAMLKFSNGTAGVDVLPIEWIEEIKDLRPHVRVLDLHVKDADAHSTIRLIASSEDSSFRLQTMPDVAWRHLSDRDAREARFASRDSATTPRTVITRADTARRGTGSAADTVISKTRFADRDPVAQDELSQVVKACKVYGCRIGIRGLHPSQFDEFSTYLRKLGADSVAITTEIMASTTLAMMEITPKRNAPLH